jgi:hypothetical protein
MLSFHGFLQLREVNVNGPKTDAAWMALKEATKTQSQAAGSCGMISCNIMPINVNHIITHTISYSLKVHRVKDIDLNSPHT